MLKSYCQPSLHVYVHFIRKAMLGEELVARVGQCWLDLADLPKRKGKEGPQQPQSTEFSDNLERSKTTIGKNSGIIFFLKKGKFFSKCREGNRMCCG